MAHDADTLALYKLSLLVGSGEYSIDDCREIVRDNAVLTERVLAAAFRPSLLGADARHAFGILDTCKALLARRMSFERRSKALGFEPDLIVGLMGGTYEIDNYLKNHAAISVCSLYLAPDGQTWCIFAHSSTNHAEFQYDAIRIVNEHAAPHFLRELQHYVRSLSFTSPDFTVQASLLQTLGAAILPAIAKLGIHGPLIIIPHRLLHILPLHCMSAQFNGQHTYIDQLVRSISYSSSLFEMYSPRIVAGRQGFKDKQAKMLAVMDLSSTNLTWLEAERLYFEGLARMGLPVDIVTTEEKLPTDVSNYIWISWGSHAKSDPANWGGSFLAFGGTVHSARKIAFEWTCSFKPWVLLSACESAMDTAETAEIDEYCGLDMAFYIAGAWGVCATMWPVRDEMAALADILLTHSVLFHGQDPPQALITLKRMLRIGNWRPLIETGGDYLTSEMRKSFQMMQQLSDNAFTSIRDWGVFRSYGTSYQ